MYIEVYFKGGRGKLNRNLNQKKVQTYGKMQEQLKIKNFNLTPKDEAI